MNKRTLLVLALLLTIGAGTLWTQSSESQTAVDDIVMALTESVDPGGEVSLVIGAARDVSDPELNRRDIRNMIQTAFIVNGPAEWPVRVSGTFDGLASLAETIASENLSNASSRQPSTHFVVIDVLPLSGGSVVALSLVGIESLDAVAGSIGFVPDGRTDSPLTDSGSFARLDEAIGGLAAELSESLDLSDGAGFTLRVTPAETNDALPKLEAFIAAWLQPALLNALPSGVVLKLESEATSAVRESGSASGTSGGGVVVLEQTAAVNTLIQVEYVVDPTTRQLNLEATAVDLATMQFLPGRPQASLALSSLPDFALGGTGSATIQTVPEGMAIRLDGRFVGRSPVRISGLTQGSYRLQVLGEPPFATIEDALVVSESGDSREYSYVMEQPRIRLQVVEAGTGDPVDNARIDGEASLARIGSGLYQSAPVATERDGVLNLVVWTDDHFREPVEIGISPAGNTVIPVEVTLSRRDRVGLSVISEPPNAALFVDGAYIGQTPVSNHTIRPSERAVPIRLMHSEYEMYESVVDIADLQAGPMIVALERSVRLESTPSGAVVEVDGQVVGRTGLDVFIPARDTVVTLRLGSYTESVTLNAATLEERTLSFAITPQAREVTLHLRTNVSGARVWIDQREIELPGDGRVEVPSGARYIRVMRTGFAPYSTTAFVSADLELPVFLVPFETRALLETGAEERESGDFDAAYEALDRAFEQMPEVPEVVAQMMQTCVDALVHRDRALFRRSEIARWVDRMERLVNVTRLDLSGPEWNPEILYELARYREYLWDANRHDPALAEGTIAAYQDFLASERIRSQILSANRPAALPDALFAIARVHYETFVASESSTVTQASVEQAIRSYLYQRDDALDPEKVDEAARWLADLERSGTR